MENVNERIKKLEELRKEYKETSKEVQEATKQLEEQLPEGLDLLNRIKQRIIDFRKLRKFARMTELEAVMKDIQEQTSHFLKQVKKVETENTEPKKKQQ